MEQFGADFADEKQTAFAGTAGSKSKQEKERRVAYAPASRAHRPATPTVRPFWGI